MINKNTVKIFLLFLFCLNGIAQVNPREERIEIFMGIDKVIRLDFVPTTIKEIADNTVVDMTFVPQKREITIKGLKPGVSSISVRNDATKDIAIRYFVTVTATEKTKVINELKDFFSDIEGVEVGIKGGKVFVGGRLVVPSDIGKVVLFLDDYKDVLNLLEVSPQTYQIIAKEMQEGMRRNNLKDVTVRFFNNSYILEGIVGSEKEKELATKIGITYLPDRIESLARRTDSVQKLEQEIIKNFIVVNETEPPPKPVKMIKFTAQFVELTKDYNKVFGFKWNPTLGGEGGSISFGRTSSGGVSTSSDGTLSGTISQLFPKLNSAKAAGYARIVQSGMIIAKDNENGTITRKTKKNTTLGTGEFQQPTSIDAGFDLKLKGTIMPEEKVNIEISLGVSFGSGTDVLENTINTIIIVKTRESAVVGGVSSTKSSTQYDKDPPGGADTVEAGSGFPLFSFIKSKSLSRSKEQFVVFITPEIIDSASAGSEEIKRKFRKRGP